MKRKNWKDRTGVIGAVTAVLIIVLIAALVCVAYMALAYEPNTSSPKQPDVDLNGDGEEDPIIGYLQITIEMEMDNSAWLGGFDQSIEGVSATLVDTPPSMSMLGNFLSLFETDQDMKLTVRVTMPSLDQIIMTESQGTITWHYEIPGSTTRTDYQEICTGGIRYRGAYVIEVALYNEDGQVDQETMTVTI